MTTKSCFDTLFSGVIGHDYQLLKLICPLATEMSRLVGVVAAEFCRDRAGSINVVELGGGTGITTLSVLNADQRISVLSVDNEPTMQDQARQNLQYWVEAGRLTFSGDDALTALQALDENSVDLLASAYTLHNFDRDYRRQVVHEIARVLRPGGWFANGDRYGLDDVSLHTHCVQQEVAGYFKVLIGIDRLDLLENWILHLFNDESENHLMRESVALQELVEAGFKQIQLTHRMAVNALVTAVK